VSIRDCERKESGTFPDRHVLAETLGSLVKI
jgi:hypothetical protein